MPDRTAEQIRKEIVAERQGLHRDLDALKAQLRSLAPFLVAGLLAFSLLVIAVLVGFTKLRAIR